MKMGLGVEQKSENEKAAKDRRLKKKTLRDLTVKQAEKVKGGRNV
jgi:hypothetical protein